MRWVRVRVRGRGRVRGRVRARVRVRVGVTDRARAGAAAFLTLTRLPPRTHHLRNVPHLPPNQSVDQAIEAIFGPVLKGSKDFNFFSYCICQRAPSLGMRMREIAGQRIAEKLGEQLPAWVKEDILALHLYASRLGGVAVHKKVEIA